MRQSHDKKAYTFELIQGRKYSDGREVTAADFKRAIERILAPSTGSTSAPLFEDIVGAKEYSEGRAGGVRGIKVEGPYSLVIELTRPDKHFLFNLGVPEADALPPGAHD